MPEYYFFKEDYLILEKIVKSLQDKIIELGKEQGIVSSQSTENFGHDDACQEVIEHDRRLVIRRLDELKKVLTLATIIEPITNLQKIRFGSIVKLNTGQTYQIGSYRVFANHKIKNISYDSPLGRKLISREVGDDIVHNGTIITILEVN